MNLNPEFQRQLYLEVSHARLIGVPLVLGVIFTLCYFLDGYRLGTSTANTALTLYMLITLLWGARQTIDSIVEEYRERTWDTQRLSALGPWDMSWGKLFGSTVMVWYAGALCLLVYALATDNPSNLPLLLFYGICSALLVQAGGLLLGLLAAQRGQSKSGSIFIIAVIGFLSIAPWLSKTASVTSYAFSLKTLSWYDWTVNSESFQQCSLLLALFWCAVGIYRLMAQELGMRTLPWVWLAFSVFLIVYLGGLLPSSTYSFSLIAFAVCAGLTYLGLMVERNDAMRIKRLLTYFAERNWRRVGEETPIWWLSYALALPAALVLSLSESPWRDFGAAFHFYPLAIVLILLRDCAIYLYFFYGNNPQRALSLTLLAGILLYGVIPGLFNAIGQNGLAALFFPLWADSAGTGVSCALIQVGLILNLLYRRWTVSTRNTNSTR
ncbi:ABC transporter permease [Methylomonas rapida]|uniref:ABC-2 type transporter transmembrane domain-containing protein n=1 Tax=Methylomonas rapida TaxID=2963939 RepID=A0ABY7GFZ7_9GAMM|nr:ABC transporter permease [Methylomonas rapida]WAR43139.1 hypothetical protein NM686_012110 [Methylomonas rapida]